MCECYYPYFTWYTHCGHTRVALRRTFNYSRPWSSYTFSQYISPNTIANLVFHTRLTAIYRTKSTNDVNLVVIVIGLIYFNIRYTLKHSHTPSPLITIVFHLFAYIPPDHTAITPVNYKQKTARIIEQSRYSEHPPRRNAVFTHNSTKLAIARIQINIYIRDEERNARADFPTATTTWRKRLLRRNARRCRLCEASQSRQTRRLVGARSSMSERSRALYVRARLTLTIGLWWHVASIWTRYITMSRVAVYV